MIRRAYLDLTGLPPSPAQVNAFVNDPAPSAFAKVVRSCRLPRYGERWGRHWLDTVRFADSGGFEYDRDRPNAWRYRDYVIRAFNTDKPYDRFVKEQLAGDEIWPDSSEARIAVGYLRLGLENNIKNDQTRLDELDDLVSTTSNAFLGLTVGCARCHNHKFIDPAERLLPYAGGLLSGQDARISAGVSRRHCAVRSGTETNRRIAEPWKEQLKQLEKPYRDRWMEEKRAKLPDYIQLALKTAPEKRTEGQKLNATQVEKTLAIEPKELLDPLPRRPGEA